MSLEKNLDILGLYTIGLPSIWKQRMSQWRQAKHLPESVESDGENSNCSFPVNEDTKLMDKS